MRTKNILVPSEINIMNILRESKELTFLVGAGISIEPPSSLASAQDIVKTIIESCVEEKVIHKLLDNYTIRYDYLIEKFRDYFDPTLKILRYFKEKRSPNLIHSYLAEMIKKRNIVMTTNFDELIEKAMGFDYNLFRVIITENDFKRYSNPLNNQHKDLTLLYKLHGDLKNPVTGEDTFKTIISTLDAYHIGGMDKIVPIESYKIPFFRRACYNRILVVLGYSGSDDFDIIPTLLQMEKIKRMIWISHEENKDAEIKKYIVDSNKKLTHLDLKNLSNELQTLYKLNSRKNIKCHFIKQHTGRLISRVTEKELELTERNENPSFSQWFKKNFNSFEKNLKLDFTIDLLINYGLFDNALYYCNRNYQESLNEQNKLRAATALYKIGICLYCKGEYKEAIEHYSKNYDYILRYGGLYRISNVLKGLSSAYSQIGQHQNSLEYAFKALEIYKELKDEQGIASMNSRIGCSYRDTKNFKLGLQYHLKSYNYNKKTGNLGGLSFDLANMSDIYISLGQLSKALKYLNEAKQIITKLGSHYGLGLILISFGMFFDTQGNNHKALEYFKEAYYYGTIVYNNDLMAAALGHLGAIHVNLGNYKEAKSNLIKAIELDKASKNLFGLSTDYINVGYLFIHQQKGNEALKWYLKAYKILKNIDNQKELANCMVGLGNAFLQKEEPLKAEKCYRRAYTIYKKLDHQEGIADTNFNMGLVNIHQGKIANGKKYLKIAMNISSRLGNSSRIAEIKKIFSILRKNGTIRFT